MPNHWRATRIYCIHRHGERCKEIFLGNSRHMNFPWTSVNGRWWLCQISLFSWTCTTSLCGIADDNTHHIPSTNQFCGTFCPVFPLGDPQWFKLSYVFGGLGKVPPPKRGVLAFSHFDGIRMASQPILNPLKGSYWQRKCPQNSAESARKKRLPLRTNAPELPKI